LAAAATAARREALHRRGVRLEVFTVAWNAVEGVVAISAGIATASSARAERWAARSSRPTPWRRGSASYLSLALLVGVGLNAACGWWWADPAGALAMLPVILWQGFVTLGEAREGGEDTK